ncbi:MAG TPA: DUF1840 family protein [Steroidobacteraceae bacterium]|nr:DUF1840 family protein [Steroidobacteraceae bacterium]
MIVRFNSRSGSLAMLGESAVTLLKLGGHSGSVPGAVLAPDLAAFLERLDAGLAEHGGEPSPPPAPEPAEPGETEREREDREATPVVTLRMRAVPLRELVRTAIVQQSNLMWERD